MSSRYKVIEDWLPHHLTFTVIQWMDVFCREAYKQIVIESLSFCIEKKGLQLHGWVIMPNHIHLIASMRGDHKMPDFVRDFKKFTSKKIITAIGDNKGESRKWLLNAFSYAGRNNGSNEQYQFWQQDYHPIELGDRARLIQRMKYLHQNPVRAGIVFEPHYYKYSSAVDYFEGRIGLLPLVMVEREGMVVW